MIHWLRSRVRAQQEYRHTDSPVVDHIPDIIAAPVAPATVACPELVAINRSQAVIEFSMHGRITNANENFLTVMDYSLDEMVGRHQSMFMDRSDARSEAYASFWRRLGKGEHFSAVA